MEQYRAEGRLYFSKNGGTPSYIRYLDEMPGVPLQNDWDDIKPTPGGESLGYQRQIPVSAVGVLTGQRAAVSGPQERRRRRHRCLIFFQDDSGAAKIIVVSVKGGDNVNVAMVRDLAHVVKREKAEIGLFVTLAESSKPMVTEAIKEGFYVSPQTGVQLPRIQILTIAGLLDGSERARYPDIAQGGHTFKKAKREQGKAGQTGLFVLTAQSVKT